MSSEEEVMHVEEIPMQNKLPENEKQYALFTDRSSSIVWKPWRWKTAVWSFTQQVTETAEGEDELSLFAEVKAIQLSLDISEKESESRQFAEVKVIQLALDVAERESD